MLSDIFLLGLIPVAMATFATAQELVCVLSSIKVVNGSLSTPASHRTADCERLMSISCSYSAVTTITKLVAG